MRRDPRATPSEFTGQTRAAEGGGVEEEPTEGTVVELVDAGVLAEVTLVTGLAATEVATAAAAITDGIATGETAAGATKGAAATTIGSVGTAATSAAVRPCGTATREPTTAGDASAAAAIAGTAAATAGTAAGVATSAAGATSEATGAGADCGGANTPVSGAFFLGRPLVLPVPRAVAEAGADCVTGIRRAAGVSGPARTEENAWGVAGWLGELPSETVRKIPGSVFEDQVDDDELEEPEEAEELEEPWPGFLTGIVLKKLQSMNTISLMIGIK